FLSVSKTPEAIGSWGSWALDMRLNNHTKTAFYPDFPGLGFDQKAIYMTSNMFDAQDNFKYAKIRVLKKSQVYAFAGLNWHDLWGMTDATGKKAINIQPVQSFGNTPVEYLVSTNAISGNKISLWVISN